MTELSLFDELDLPASAAAPKMPEPIEPPPMGEDEENDWNNDDFELIEDLVGPDLAMRIADVFGGSSIYIPKNDLISSKYNSIRRKYRAGATYRELSAEFKYSKGHIRHIIHGKNRAHGGD